MERLEELDDVQRVYTNLEISEAVLQAYDER
jgi:transcriptional/translational regulatory protein YebC/TACO1